MRRPVLCRASDFIVALLHRLHDDPQVSLRTAANAAYYKTLYNNHTWYTSAAFVVVLKVSLSSLIILHAHAHILGGGGASLCAHRMPLGRVSHP